VLRNLWVARRLVAAAVVLGVLLWFIVINSQSATVYFPFGLGSPTASIGIIVLVSAVAGSIVTGLIMTILWAWKRYRVPSARPNGVESASPSEVDEGTSDGCAAGAEEGFSDARWSAR
jgi:uncharacterized integral membrane protein